MAKSASKRTHRIARFAAKGVESSRLRQRKYALVRRFGFPEELLGGALTLTHRRCGKAGCRCAAGERHPMWTLTYSVDGNRHVEVIPRELVEQLKPLVDRCREHLDALRELGAINAQLLHLWRKEQRNRPARSTRRSTKQTKRRPARRTSPRRLGSLATLLKKTSAGDQRG